MIILFVYLGVDVVYLLPYCYWKCGLVDCFAGRRGWGFYCYTLCLWVLLCVSFVFDCLTTGCVVLICGLHVLFITICLLCVFTCVGLL